MTAQGKRQPGTFFVMDRDSLKALFALHRRSILTYLQLASRADSKGRCWPSITSIAMDTGLTRRSTLRAIADLQSVGLIEVDSGKGCRQTSTYRMVTPMSLFDSRNGDTQVTRMVTPVSHNGDARVTNNGDTGVTRNETHKNEIQERDSLNEKKSAAKAACLSVLFDDFWKVYPLRTGQKKARKAFQKAIESVSEAAADCVERRLQLAEAIIDAAKEFAQSPLGQGEYCPYPATWLNDERWLDDRAAWSAGRTTNTRRGAGAIYDPKAAERNPNHGKFFSNRT